MALRGTGTNERLIFTTSAADTDLKKYTVSAIVSMTSLDGGGNCIFHSKGYQAQLNKAADETRRSINLYNAFTTTPSHAYATKDSYSLGTIVNAVITFDDTAGSTAHQKTNIYMNGSLISPGLYSDPVGTRVSNARTSFYIARYLFGIQAEAALWSVVLSAAEINSLFKGFSPRRIRPQALISHTPLVRDLIDRKNGAVGVFYLADNSVTIATHPRCYA